MSLFVCLPGRLPRWIQHSDHILGSQGPAICRGPAAWRRVRFDALIRNINILGFISRYQYIRLIYIYICIYIYIYMYIYICIYIYINIINNNKIMSLIMLWYLKLTIIYLDIHQFLILCWYPLMDDIISYLQFLVFPVDRQSPVSSDSRTASISTMNPKVSLCTER